MESSLPRHDRTVVYIVDDDPDDCMMITRAFASRADRQILEIHDGESLLTTLRSNFEAADPDDDPGSLLVLLDINMPGLNGLETLELLKADAALRHIPTIILTTSDAPEHVARSYELGASAYVKKPASFDELQDIVQAIDQFWLDVVRIPPARRR